jgi:hypothetical protein
MLAGISKLTTPRENQTKEAPKLILPRSNYLGKAIQGPLLIGFSQY